MSMYIRTGLTINMSAPSSTSRAAALNAKPVLSEGNW